MGFFRGFLLDAKKEEEKKPKPGAAAAPVPAPRGAGGTIIGGAPSATHGRCWGRAPGATSTWEAARRTGCRPKKLLHPGAGGESSPRGGTGGAWADTEGMQHRGGQRSALLQPQVQPSTWGGSWCHPEPPGLPVGAATSLLAEPPRGDGGDIHSASHGEGSPQGARSSGTPPEASCPSGSPIPVRCDVLLQEGRPGWEGVRAIGTVAVSISPGEGSVPCRSHHGPGEGLSARGPPVRFSLTRGSLD